MKSRYYQKEHESFDDLQHRLRTTQRLLVAEQNGFVCDCCEKPRRADQWEFRESETRLICSVCVGSLAYADMKIAKKRGQQTVTEQMSLF